jgi:hypothetical protein
VNLDKEPKEKPTGVTLPPMPLSFCRNPACELSTDKLQRGGKLVQAARHAIKVMAAGTAKGAANGGAPAGAAAALLAAPAVAPAAAALLAQRKAHGR